MNPQLSRRTSYYEFGSFRLDPVKCLLVRDGEKVPLAQKAFDTLLLLVQNSERVVTKDELMRAVWPDTIVEENNLTQSISVLRKTLGESRKDHKYIVTIQGRGYRFVADVRQVYNQDTDVILVERTRASIVIEEEIEKETEVSSTRPKTNLGLASLTHLSLRTRTLLGGFLLLLMCAGLYFLTSTRPAEPTVANVRSVAVVPFKSLSNDPGDEYLSSGITEALTAKLSHIRRLTVPSSGAAIGQQAAGQDALTVGRKLHVDSVLEGTIQKDGEHIRVTVRLLSVADGKMLWAGSFDEKLTEIFALQDSISEQVAQALSLKLTGGEQQLLAKHYTDNAEAYQAYIKGRYFWNKRTEPGLVKAIEYFRQAISVDQNYALAYAGLADAYLMIAAYRYSSLPPEEAAQIAKSAAMRALELDETLAEAHTSLAGFMEVAAHDVSGAEREYKRAIELNPNYATARQWYGELLRTQGRFEEALVELKRAQELDPLSPIMNSSLGISYYYARQYDLMIEQNKKALEIDPNFTPAHFGLGLAFEQKAMYQAAIAEFQLAKDLSRNDEPMIAALGHAYAKSGDRVSALRVFTEFKKKRPTASYFNLALFYVAFGEKEKALPLLQKARAKPSDQLMLKLDPRLDSLRSDSAFEDVFKS